VDVFPTADGPGGVADMLAILDDGASLRQIPQGRLVVEGYVGGGGKGKCLTLPLIADLSAGGYSLGNGNHIVV